MPRYRIVHRSAYRFDAPCRPELLVQLRPRERRHQRTAFFQLSCRPLCDHPSSEIDADGNERTTLRFREPLHTLVVVATSLVDREAGGGSAPAALDEPWRPVADCGARYLESSPRIEIERFTAHARDLFTPGATLGAVLQRAFARLHQDIAYARSTEVSATAAEILATGRGQCQDFAQVAIGVLRAAGIPARYVGGYHLVTGELHAWVSLRTRHGWLDVDPTLGRLDAGEHLTLAIGRDRHDVSPIEGADHARLALAVRVEPAD